MWQAVPLEARTVGMSAVMAVMMLAGDVAARPGDPATPGRVIAGLEEPLVATAPTSPQDDRALDLAIAAFRIAVAKTPADAAAQLAPLAGFVEAHPHSGWNAAVLANLGLAYLRSGYFARALDCWHGAWREARDATEIGARELADRAVGELARLHAQLGHLEDLDKLFKEIGNRPLGARAAEAVSGARDAAWSMRHDPGAAYRCGTSALRTVVVARGATIDSVAFLDHERSGQRGFSLAQLAGLAERTGRHYRLIHRQPGEAVPVPSVVHWNANHFAAIVGERDGGYVIKDAAAGAASGELWVRQAAIDSQTSGFFLAPGDVAQDPRWRDVTAAEASRIFGMGFTGLGRAAASSVMRARSMRAVRGS
ncbi:MAG TPA: cysteine peptidase family C39 domain-containing protein [Kofleriaceae bacterium]